MSTAVLVGITVGALAIHAVAVWATVRTVAVWALTIHTLPIGTLPVNALASVALAIHAVLIPVSRSNRRHSVIVGVVLWSVPWNGAGWLAVEVIGLSWDR